MPSAASTTITTSTPSLVGKSEVDVELLLPGGSLEVHHGLFFLGIRLFLVFLLVDGSFLPLGVHIRALASFPQVELGTLLLGLHGLPFIQSHLLLFLFASELGLQFLRGQLSRSLGFLLLGFALVGFRVHGCIGLITLLRNVILKSAPVALSSSTSLVLCLYSSPGVSGFPVK